MRVYSWRHVIGLWTIVAACVLGGIAPLKAQDWFRQRTYDGQAAPVTIDLAKRTIDDITKAVTVTRPPTPRVFSATGLPLAIPDGPNNPNGVSSTIAVPAISPYVNVTVSVNITHPVSSQLVVTLTSPTGAVFTVSTGSGAANIVLVDQAVAVTAGSAVQGNWVMKVVDRIGSSVGQLVSWSLTVNVPSNTALIDLTISLEANPAGDNNGNTQGAAGSAEQDKWERIVQYFADGVYEMTEGAHKIRQVRIFRKARNFGAADIRWGKKGHPHVPSNGGVGVAGGHVEMFETFEAGGAGGADYDMLADEIGSGYTMAHEWGHFFLGLYDEYNPACGTTAVSVSPSIMNSQWNAKAGDRQWLNFSIKRQSGGSFQDTLLNCQHYAYQASAWEVLARAVSADPTDQISKGFQTLGPRIFYPELATVAPSGTATPRNDLDAAGSSARSALDIVWMGDGQTVEIVIDHSGSMGADNKLQNALTAAQLLVDQAVLGQTRIGVTQFDSAAQSVFPLTVVATEQIRSQIKAAIAAIPLAGGTEIGVAAAFALNKLLNAGIPAGENKVVYLLTDGQSDRTSALAVVPSYVAAHVPMFTFGFGADADSDLLSQMASGTGGQFFFSPTTLPQIVAAFQAANAVATSSPSLGAGSLSPTASAPAQVGIPVDASVNTVQLSVSYNGTLLAPTAIQLLTPSGQVVTPTATTTTATATVSGGTVVFYNVATPAVGLWQLTGNTAAAGRSLGYSASAIQTGVGYTVNTGLRDSGPTVTKKGPVILESRLVHRQPVTAATVTAGITTPSGTTTPLPMADGGVFPDAVAGDGVYTGIYTPTAAGSYSLNVAFTNPNNAARETYQGAAISPTPAGGVGFIPADSLVGENFSRGQTIQFSVESTAVGNVLPTLTTQPSPQFVKVGGNISFLVTATGTPTPTYQWQRKPAGATAFANLTAGGNFSGVTTGTLLITGATPAMSGDQYQCVVSNSVGSVTTNAATLTVTGTLVLPKLDHDGDHKSDVVVFRPQTGTWYVRYSSSGYTTADAIQWGLPGDIPISGDFDGDGKLELTVWRPSNGTWYVRYSSQNYALGSSLAFQWGLPGDVPIADDFDGDGKTDLVVWRPVNGTWYVRYSSQNYALATSLAFQWGLPGDLPISADVDGDGKADLVVWRPANGTWYVRFSGTGYAFATAGALQWGLPQDVPISAADFDGDGKTDLVVWRPSNGTWYIRYSGQGFTTADAFQWGLPGDVPVATDFDADGKSELAVWRPVNGTWYIRYSSQSYGTSNSYQWGLPGDILTQ
jgi:subtilisin-like proprotein convertase family protein